MRVRVASSPRRRFPSREVRRCGAVAVALLLLAGCATKTARAVDSAAGDRLLRLVAARLDVAPAVARSKWNSHAAIEDPVREAQVVANVAAQAADYGLSGQLAESFFRAQIEASKIVQRALHAEWTARRQGRFSTVADLDRDIRPVLDRLTPELLRALAAAAADLSDPAGRRWFERHSRSIVTPVPGRRDAVRMALAPLVSGADSP